LLDFSTEQEKVSINRKGADLTLRAFSENSGEKNMNNYYNQTNFTSPEIVLIDLSGHSDFKIDVKNMSNFQSYIDEALRMFDSFSKTDLTACRTGKVILILPGLATLTATFMSLFHGRFGYFPRIKWYIRNSETGQFQISDSFLDLQHIRNKSRRNLR